MESMAAIISAMMNMQPPQVTPMGAAPGGGGGGMRVGGGGGRGGSMGYGREPQRQEAPPMDLPDVMGPQTDTTETQFPYRQGMEPGAQEQGGALSDSSMPDVTPLIRQYQEADELVRKYSNPKSVKDAWQSREELPKARERLAQAQMNIQAYNQTQSAISNKNNAQQILKAAVPIVGFEQAQNMADFAFNNPDKSEMIMEQLTRSAETQRAEGAGYQREDALEERDEVSSFHFLKQVGVPDHIASAMSINNETPAVEMADWWFKRGDEATQNEKVNFLEEQTKAQTLSEVDNVVKQIGNTLDISGGLGATGFISALTNMVPGSPAYNTVASIDTQKAVNAFKALKDMREASKTGGALGNVSNREIELLYSAFTALDPQMGDQFGANIADVMQRFERVRYMMQNESRYLEQYQRGEITGEEMFQDATRVTNQRTAERMGTPQQALDDLYANPSSVSDFKTTFGWTPTSMIQD